VAQVTLSLLLLIGAGLYSQPEKNLKASDRGIQNAKLLTFAIDPPLNGYKAERSREILRQNYEKPECAAGCGIGEPGDHAGDGGRRVGQSYTVDSFQAKPNEGLDPHMNFVRRGYFQNDGRADCSRSRFPAIGSGQGRAEGSA